MYLNKVDICDNIERILKSYSLNEVIKISENDIIDNENPVILKNDLISKPESQIKEIKRKNIFGNYFDSLTVRRENDRGIFYHFIKYKYLTTILDNDEIRLNSLSSILDNDPLEYSDLKNIVSPQRIWFTDDKETKDNIFIFCFTKDFRNRKFWKTYGTNNVNDKVENIAVGFRFKNFSDFNSNFEYLQPIKLRDVIYNIKNRFDFMREIQATLTKKFDRHFQFDNIHEFAGFFKREKYQWEDEVRLFFNYGSYDFFNKMGLDYRKYLLENKDFEKHDGYTTFQLKNSIFELEIIEFICGKDIEEKKYKELEQKAKEKNINIWKYDNY